MKIILSHDVDHLYWKEHYFKDLFVFGVIYRNLKAFFKREIGIALFFKRMKMWGRMHQIPELICFYEKKKIKSNVFFGMDNELRLSYNYKKSKPWIQKLIENEHKVGVHGIAFDDKIGIQKEYVRFVNISGIKKIGIRTHYLRFSKNSHKFFNEQGYMYDSSIESIESPFLNNSIWEIPISIMDASLVKNAQSNQNIDDWKKATMNKLIEAKKKEIPYFVINTHDLYFTDSFPVILEWYLWIIDYLTENNYKFITFEEAIKELNK
jgi:hypothetical protein